MSETRVVASVAFAVAGALLLMAVVLIVGVVLDLPAGLVGVLLGLGLVIGAWYGWRLAKTTRTGGAARR